MRKRILVVVAALVATFAPTVGASGETASEPITYYFRTPTQGNVDQVARGGAVGAGPTMDPAPPTKSEPSTAVGWVGDAAVEKGTAQPVWQGAVTGTIVGTATTTFWANSPFMDEITVSLHADGSPTPFANAVTTIEPLSEPGKYEVVFQDLQQTIASSLVVVINTRSQIIKAVTLSNVARTPTLYYFDSVDYPSNLTFTLGEAVPDPVLPPPPFISFEAPDEFDRSGNETSIGVNPKTNAVLFQLSLDTARVEFDHSTTPPTATWKKVSSAYTSAITVDPMMHTDRATGRTFVSQLVGGGSVTAFTDDDGETWTLAQPPTAAPGWDHQSTASGPFAGPVPAGSAYGRATYYCAQGGIMNGACSRSDDGGTTWNPPVVFNQGVCNGLHGRPMVGNTGAVHVPVKSCERLMGVGTSIGDIGTNMGAGPYQGLFTSLDDGQTWRMSLTQIPSGESDPALATDAANRLYFVGTHEGQALVTTSDDNGATFSTPVDVAASHGLQNVQFASIVAGDPGRAAVSFYGTPDPGDDQDAGYTGEWHMYTSITIDGGATWTTYDITPYDPVQRGMICLSGTTCTAGRNLLDFQHMTVDRDGRVLVAYADGCTTRECRRAEGKTNAQARSTDSLGVIAVQAVGPRLYAGSQ